MKGGRERIGRGDPGPEGKEAGDGRSLEEVRQADELLQVMFWMRGEELGERVEPARLAVFLGRRVDDGEVRVVLEGLRRRGLVEEVEGDRYRLTEAGILEGGRRFADEFAGLTGQAHGECSDPDCSCHTDPGAALACHLERHGVAPPGGG